MNDHRAFWSRVFTYIPTPTKDDGETIDETPLRQVIDYQIEHHVDGICVLGSTGGKGSFSDRAAAAPAADVGRGRSR
jgi:dihydrodipicolinate synthase/N-acetylneuraminate lyase